MRAMFILCAMVLPCGFVMWVTLSHMTTIARLLPKSYRFNSSTSRYRKGGLQGTQEGQNVADNAEEEQPKKPKPRTTQAAPSELFANEKQTLQSEALLNGTKSAKKSADLSRVKEEVKRQPLAASSTRRRNLLILSQGRGGSSFLGELFNNHPDIVYVFEPLNTAQDLLKVNVFFQKPTDVYGLLCNKILDSFFKCDFSNITNTLPLFSRTAFRLRSEALIGHFFCTDRRPQNYIDLRDPKKCVPLTNAPLSKACTSYKHTVVKILSTRLPNETLEGFRGLFEHPNGGYDVKIVNLVRDPRAVVYSWVTLAWIKNHRNPGFRLNVRKICQPIEKNLRLGLSPPEWLQNRIKIIRYEDLVANTTEVSRQLYSFAGLLGLRTLKSGSRSIRRLKRNSKEIILIRCTRMAQLL